MVQAQRSKKYYLGDYYPLVSQQRNPAAWTAYHLYLPAEQAGMLVALRREKSDIRAMTFDLLTIDPAKDWQFEDYDSGTTWVVSGKELRDKGLEVVIPNRRASRLIFYASASSPFAPRKWRESETVAASVTGDAAAQRAGMRHRTARGRQSPTRQRYCGRDSRPVRLWLRLTDEHHRRGKPLGPQLCLLN